MKIIYNFILCLCLVCIIVVLAKPAKLQDTTEDVTSYKLDNHIDTEDGVRKLVRRKRFFLPALSIANFLGISPLQTPLIPSIEIVGVQLPLKTGRGGQKRGRHLG